MPTEPSPPRPQAVPVARLAPARPVAPPPEPTPDEEGVLSRPSLLGLGFSLAMHALLLVAMAVWYFAPPRDEVKRFDTALEAGSPFGDELGTSLKGGLGMDEPLALAEGPAAPSTPTITSLPIGELKLDPALTSKRAGAPGGGGVSLSGSGAAGAGDGFGVAKFGSGGEDINGVRVKVGDPQFTLIWDSKVDLDLHVIEPGGSEIFWAERVGKDGGELDVDDIDGRGPENVNYGGGKGVGPPGIYIWYVDYYGSRDSVSLPTKWKVRVKRDGVVTVHSGRFKRIGEQSKRFTLSLDRASTTEVEK